MHSRMTRRALLGSVPMLVPGAALGSYVSSTDGFSYEVTRTAEEWREMLGDVAYKIMREGGTEVPKSDPHWDSLEPGTYACRGCDLPLYDARWKVVLDIGWLFFKHSEANALLMGIDWPDGSGMADEFASLAAVEVHCRRCGSHMGHIVIAEEQLLHCINGASMTFTAAA